MPLVNENVFIRLETLGEKDKFKAYFYYGSDESRELGCFILNRLLDEFPEAKISLIPTDRLDQAGLILGLGVFETEKVFLNQ